MSSNGRVRPYNKTNIEIKSGTSEYSKEYYRKFLAGNKTSRYAEEEGGRGENECTTS